MDCRFLKGVIMISKKTLLCDLHLDQIIFGMFRSIVNLFWGVIIFVVMMKIISLIFNINIGVLNVYFEGIKYVSGSVIHWVKTV
jgi:hypothetical protein